MSNTSSIDTQHLGETGDRLGEQPGIAIDMVGTQQAGIIAAGNQAPMEATTESQLDILAAKIYDPASYGAVRGINVSSGQRTANTTAIQAAADAAAVNDGILEIKGLYETDGTVTCASHVDARAGILRVVSTAIAPVLRIGSAISGNEVFDRYVWLPEVIQGAKVGTGWSGSDVGVEISNLYHSQVTIPHIKNFATNLLVTSYGTGNVHNNYFLGWLENGKVNIRLAVGDSGAWVNQNTFIGGRASHQSAEGTNVPGTRHILIDDAAHAINGNEFEGLSVEGDVSQYHLYCYGQYHRFVNCRWEATTPRAHYEAGDALYNLIEGGYQAQNVAVTEANGAHSNKRSDALRTTWRANGGAQGVFNLQNSSSSANPALIVMDALAASTDDPASAYALAIGPQKTRYKRSSDAFPRVELNGSTASIGMDNGVQAPRNVMTPFSNIGIRFSTGIQPGTFSALPTASVNYRGMVYRVEGGPGVADALYICEKNDQNGYAWRQI